MPPRPTPEQERAARLLKTLGSPEPELLDALLDGVDIESVVSSASAIAAVELASLACLAEVEAYEFLQRCSREQKGKLRGCSAQLLALALEQSLALYRWGAELAVRRAAQERAKALLLELGRQAPIQIEQAWTLIFKVGDEAVRARLSESRPDTPRPPVQEIDGLVAIAQGMLDDAPPRMTTRAILYGLDASFLDGLKALALELTETERVATMNLLDDAGRDAMKRSHAATWLLATHFADAFASARRLDDGIPSLRGTDKLRPPPARKSGTRAAAPSANMPPSSRSARDLMAPNSGIAGDPSPLGVLRVSNRS